MCDTHTKAYRARFRQRGKTVNTRTYQRNVMLAMAVYVAVVLTIWPLARTTSSLPLKLLFALAPLPPLIYIIWLAARRILHSDELEQRTHLVGLGVATVAVSVFSLIGGFLASSNVLSQQTAAAVLMGVVPIMTLTYAAARWWVTRRYGTDIICDDNDAYPPYVVALGAAGLVAVLAVWAYIKHATGFQLALLAGMTALLTLAGLFAGLRRWKRQHE